MTTVDALRITTVWTARLTLVLFVGAFVLLGSRLSTWRQTHACRAAAAAMVLHLVALTVLRHHTGQVILSFASASKAIVSGGGAVAAAIVVAGWGAGTRSWYRWLTYWPWGVFLFTYVFLQRHGDSVPRIRADPWSFGPVVVMLGVAFVLRLVRDARMFRRGASAGPTARRSPS